jgi:hypothetical protein
MVGDGEQFSNFHPPHARVMSTEIAIGPRPLMEKYHFIYDWFNSPEADPYLTKENRHLDLTPERTFNCDILLTTYFRDVLQIPLCETKFPADVKWPYDVYRIMGRHTKNLY